MERLADTDTKGADANSVDLCGMSIVEKSSADVRLREQFDIAG